MGHCGAVAAFAGRDLQGQDPGRAVADEECEDDCGSRSCVLCVKCVFVFGGSASCAISGASMLQFCSLTSHDLRFGVALAPTQPHAMFMFRCAGIVDLLCSSLCSCIACSYLCCRISSVVPRVWSRVFFVCSARLRRAWRKSRSRRISTSNWLCWASQSQSEAPRLVV